MNIFETKSGPKMYEKLTFGIEEQNGKNRKNHSASIKSYKLILIIYLISVLCFSFFNKK